MLGRCKHAMIAIGPRPARLSRASTARRARIRAWPSGSCRPTSPSATSRAGATWWSAPASPRSTSGRTRIDAGASCIALRRNPTPDEQDLNVPALPVRRQRHRRLPEADLRRARRLPRQVAARAPRPHGAGGRRRSRRGRDAGRFEEAVGDITHIEPGPAGLRVRLKLRNGVDPGPIDLTGIVCGTGFVKSALSLPLIRRLAQSYDVPIERDRVRLKTNCGVPPLDRDDSRLCMMGLTANTVVPNGDTIAGLKYIARRFVGDVARAEDLRHPLVPVAACPCSSGWRARPRRRCAGSTRPRSWPEGRTRSCAPPPPEDSTPVSPAWCCRPCSARSCG